MTTIKLRPVTQKDILYTDQTWYLCKNDEEYWLHHQCGKSSNLCVQFCVQHGTGSRQADFRDISIPCTFCGSQCPTGLQGMYNMMVYL